MSFFKPSHTKSSDADSSRSANSPFVGVQAKLNIGNSNDKYEKEADAVADKVVNKNEIVGNQPFLTPSLSVQRSDDQELQKSEETELVQEKILGASNRSEVQKSPDDNGGGSWGFSTRHVPEMDDMSPEETAAYCYAKITGLPSSEILQEIEDGRIILSGTWSAKESSVDGYFYFSISKSLYTRLTGYVNNSGEEPTDAEFSDVPLFNTGTTESEEGNGTDQGNGQGVGSGSGDGMSPSRFEERGDDERRVGASDRDEYFDSLPPEEQREITQEVDRIFRELNDWDEDRAIQSNDPEQFKEFWKEIRDNILIDKIRIEQLPEEIKSIISPNGRKIPPSQYPNVKSLLQHLVELDSTELETLDRLLKSGDPSLQDPATELNVSELIELTKLMKDFTPGDFMEYMKQVSSQTSDLGEFRESVERFIERKNEKKQELEDFENTKTKLFGLEELYAAYKDFVAKVGVNRAMKTVPGDKFERQIMRNDLRETGLDDDGIATERAHLTTQMQANGFESIQEFEQYIRDYEAAFEQSAVRLAEDHLLRYRHLLYEEEKKLNDDAYLTQLLEEVQSSGAQVHYEAASEHSQNARNLTSPDDHISDPYASMRADERAKAATERRRGNSAIKGNVSSFLVQEDQFDLRELAFQDSKADLKAQMQEYIQQKYDSIDETWADLHENSEYIYKLDQLFAASMQAQGFEEGSIFHSIITDKAGRIADAEWFKTITILILAIALTIVTLGAATPLAIAAGVASVGLSLYSVYEAAETYQQNNAANDVGLLTEDPSLVWVVIAIAGAAFDVGALAAVFRAAKPIAEATKAVRTAEDLITLETKLGQIGELTSKMRSNIMKSAEAQVQANRMIQSVLRPQAGMARMAIVPGGEEFARLVAAAYYMVKKGAIDFQSFLLKLKAERIIDDIGALTAQEKVVLKDAFSKGKALGNSDPALADDLERALLENDFVRVSEIVKRLDPHVPSGSMVGKKVGHTFTKHGSHNTHELQQQAMNSGRPQGQWLDDAAAEEFIASNLHRTSSGAVNIELPEGLGRVINPDGTFSPATHARLVPSGSGVKTAYPGTLDTLPN